MDRFAGLVGHHLLLIGASVIQKLFAADCGRIFIADAPQDVGTFVLYLGLQLVDLCLHALHLGMRRGQGCAQLRILSPQFGQFLAVLAHRGIFLYFRQGIRGFAFRFFVLCFGVYTIGLSLGELILYFFEAVFRQTFLVRGGGIRQPFGLRVILELPPMLPTASSSGSNGSSATRLCLVPLSTVPLGLAG